MRNDPTCPFCGKGVSETSRISFGSTSLVRLSCGHTIQGMHVKEKTRREEIEDYESVKLNPETSRGYTPYPFQVDGAMFAEAAGLRCLIGDEMGLGKTIQALITIKSHFKEATPSLIICKAGLKYQIQSECINWMGIMSMPYLIDSTKDAILPGFPIYIVSYDTFWRLNPEKIKSLGIKLVILDECQLIKNPTAKRTFALRQFCKQVPYCIALSGTPIKNRAEEFFVILNIMRPERFPTEASFYSKYIYCYQDANGSYKSQGMKDPEAFRADTCDFIIRRTRDEVMPDLPKVRRMYRHAEITDPDLLKVYQQVTEEFTDFYDDAVISGEDNKLSFFSNLLAFYARMRNITGYAKIQACAEFVTEFLLSCDRKIVIFGHHKETLQILKENLNGWLKDGGFESCLHLHSDLSGEERNAIVERFRDSNCRVLIASTLASGEGLNLQFCSDAVMLERQWNPANEEQAEARFTRIGSTASRVDVTYILAVQTIDEFLTEIVEKKRAVVKQSLDGVDIQWNEQDLMRELAVMISIKSKGKKWSAPRGM